MANQTGAPAAVYSVMITPSQPTSAGNAATQMLSEDGKHTILPEQGRLGMNTSGPINLDCWAQYRDRDEDAEVFFAIYKPVVPTMTPRDLHWSLAWPISGTAAWRQIHIVTENMTDGPPPQPRLGRDEAVGGSLLLGGPTEDRGRGPRDSRDDARWDLELPGLAVGSASADGVCRDYLAGQAGFARAWPRSVNRPEQYKMAMGGQNTWWIGPESDEFDLFAHNRILPNLKRRSRSTTKSDAKAKPLHILPNVTEEDEQPTRHSCSSTSSVPSANHHSRLPASCATIAGRPTLDEVIHIKRDSRRVVLTGVEGLTFDDFFPPSSAPRVRTPSPPPQERIPSPPPRSAASSPASESPLDDINLRFSGLGISLDFPPPPPATIRAASRSFSRRREQSPTPSNASSDVSSAESSPSPKTPCTTPPTSDDESHCKSNLARAPTFKSQRASIFFMKSMPDLSEPVRKTSISSTVDDDSILEELEWIARDVSEIITLSSPLPPTFPATPTESPVDLRARPDSVMPLPRKQIGTGRSRASKPLPIVPRISVQESPRLTRSQPPTRPYFPA
ncbi:hypothetical protein ONZ51_g9620 [Trametes cubensis]|uniref:Uncharacterized protein n=1 Tax=Trametes cubensis TaxID=1111947 RepID=A0AAD7TMU8_9APHY|nr:hypothetical protein ONZ51_g9620 [Trametes cubensis]